MALVYAADEELWDHVQCASVLDSNSANRACCACFEPQFCPIQGLSQHDSGYCFQACHPDNGDMTRCKQLAAGCSVNIMTAMNEDFGDGQSRCNADDVQNGECRYCQHPQWCEDVEQHGFAFGGRTDTPWKWMELFYKKWFTNTRQCKYKPSQKRLFIETARQYHKRRRWDPDMEANVENEVNMYVGPGEARGGVGSRGGGVGIRRLPSGRLNVAQRSPISLSSLAFPSPQATMT